MLYCYVKIHLFHHRYDLYNIVVLLFTGYIYKLIKRVYFMMRVGVTKLYILPKAADVIGPVYMV